MILSILLMIFIANVNVKAASTITDGKADKGEEVTLEISQKYKTEAFFLSRIATIPSAVRKAIFISNPCSFRTMWKDCVRCSEKSASFRFWKSCLKKPTSPRYGTKITITPMSPVII